jgi:hypothetical protein
MLKAMMLVKPRRERKKGRPRMRWKDELERI